MSGTSVIQSNLESCNPCDDHTNKNGYQHNDDEYKQRHHYHQVISRAPHNSIVKVSNVKENLSCSIDRCDAELPIKRQLLDENELRDLFLKFGECSYYKYNLNIIPNSARLEAKQKEYWDQFYSFPRLFLTDHNVANSGDPFILQPSLFHRNSVPPTIYFKTKLTEESKPPIGLPKNLQHMFKWKISSITPNTIRNCVIFMKFDIIRPSNTTDNSYLGSWCKHMPTADFSQLDEWRKVNHYPGSFHMGRKDKLWSRLRLASQKHDKFETFHPMTFVLPKDFDDLNKFWKSSPSNLFIMKPPASARGNGVKVINDISQIPESALKLPESADGSVTKKSTIIVQQYISNPCLLENGQKFDLRIYVLITSVDPLRIYVYEEGLVRFASSKYTSQEDGIIDQYMHLTNYFVNKNNQEYKINNDCESLHGCKWTLKRFWRYIQEHYDHVNTDELWQEIIDIIVKTIICCENPMTRLSHQNCKNDYTSYELFGFDIILDENFKPWILEVNITPSLKSESNLDTSVKFRVIKDMFNLVGYHLPPPSEETRASLNHQGTDSKLFFDQRLYTETLSKRDKTKHLKYQKLFKLENEARQSGSRQQKEATESNEGTQLYLIHTDEPPCRASSQSSNSSMNPEATNELQQKSNIQENEQNGIGPENSNTVEQFSDEELYGFSSRLISSDSILSDLTQSDVRVLMLAEDELSRCGQFKRVFPSASSSCYLKYFDKPRYYNLLLDAWEQKYKDNRMEGIQRLSNLANFLD